jgi:hypothetical protein
MAACIATLRPLLQLLQYKYGWSDGPSNYQWRKRFQRKRSHSGYVNSDESNRLQQLKPNQGNYTSVSGPQPPAEAFKYKKAKAKGTDLKRSKGSMANVDLKRKPSLQIQKRVDISMRSESGTELHESGDMVNGGTFLNMADSEVCKVPTCDRRQKDDNRTVC